MRGACTGGDLTAENIHTESQGALLRCILKMQVSTALYVHLPVQARVWLIQTQLTAPWCSYPHESTVVTHRTVSLYIMFL